MTSAAKQNQETVILAHKSHWKSVLLDFTPMGWMRKNLIVPIFPDTVAARQ
jgi:hypothetical protein